MSWRSNAILAVLINYYISIALNLVPLILLATIQFHYGSTIVFGIIVIVITAVTVSEGNETNIIKNLYVFLMLWIFVGIVSFKIYHVEIINEEKPTIKVSNYSLALKDGKYHVSIIDDKSRFINGTFTVSKKEVLVLDDGFYVKPILRNYWYAENPDTLYELVDGNSSNE